MQLHEIKGKLGLNIFLLSAKKWIESTNAVGIKAAAGRYGGTYAHADIAFHFCLCLSPRFQLYIPKEFQRLKQVEAQERQDALEWSLKRLLTQINYSVQTDAIKNTLTAPACI